MLVEPTKEDVEKYFDFAYGLALDPARSGYPTYTDGIKTGRILKNLHEYVLFIKQL